IWNFKTKLLCDLSKPVDKFADKVVFVCDIDIVFYDQICPLAEQLLNSHDILFQREVCESELVNIGVIAFRPSLPVHAFWQAVQKNVQELTLWDQHVVNSVLSDADAIRRLGVR